MILENIELLSQPRSKGSNNLIQRLEEREYQIAMILLQSYQYISFAPEVIKIKVCNGLRKFSKSFEKALISYLNKMVRIEIDNKKENEKILDEIDKSPTLQKDLPETVKK